MELKVSKQKKAAICHSVPKDFSQNSPVPFHQATFYHSVSCVLLTGKPNESCRNGTKFERNALSTTKILLKRKEKNIIPSKTNAPISQTFSERLKVTIQIYQMENKELKMKLEQLQEEISKASLSDSADLSNNIKSIILELFWKLFLELFWNYFEKFCTS